MAYRVFPSGQVPTAEVLQKYLMNQVVITCVSTARPPTPVDGMTILETDTGTFRVWYGGLWARLAHVGDWTDSGGLVVPGGLTVTGGATVTGAVSATGNVSGVDVSASGDVSARGLRVSRLVKGKVGTGTATTTLLSLTADTNIAGANIQNVPVIAGHAYRLTIALDYFRVTTGSISRLDIKAWDGSVGGTQLGGTARVGMSGPASTARRQFVTVIVWAATATTTIANLNISGQSADAAGSNWTVEVNLAYVALVEDMGLDSTISNL